MKKLYSILMISVLIVSCGQNKEESVTTIIENGDLKAIRAKRKQIVKKQEKIAEELSLLDQAIASLDTVQKFPLVTTLKVKDTIFKHYLDLQGSVETKQNLILYPEMPGILTNVYVKEGQKVNRGQLLARVDDGGLAQQLSQIEVQAQLAKTTFDRQKRLWDQKIGSEIQFLQAKTNYEAQQKAVDQVKKQLAKTTIVAPFSGIIDNIMSEQGSVVANQTQIMRIVNLKNMYIETEVPERYISSISKGKYVEVYFPVLGKTVITEIRQVGNYINPNNRAFKVEIAVPNTEGNIKPNLTAKVKINDYTNPKAILIPQSIISENANGDQYTYAVSPTDIKNIALAKRVIVKTGKTQGDLIEILEGITDKDALINEGARSVRDDQKVKIIN